VLYAAALLTGAVTGATDPLHPLAGVSARKPGATLPFRRIKSVADLERALSQARQQDKPVMLDFYADWCVACLTMEQDVFGRTTVAEALAGFTLLQADVTANDAVDRELLKSLEVYGPPTILFFGRDGRERHLYRVVGEMNAAQFLAHLKKVSGS
jgi:thioredoxin:protein disulfide reductase